jgi:hypothetical protein
MFERLTPATDNSTATHRSGSGSATSKYRRTSAAPPARKTEVGTPISLSIRLLATRVATCRIMTAAAADGIQEDDG